MKPTKQCKIRQKNTVRPGGGGRTTAPPPKYATADNDILVSLPYSM